MHTTLNITFIINNTKIKLTLDAKTDNYAKSESKQVLKAGVCSSIMKVN